MKGRLELLENVRASLARAGYAVSERCTTRPVSFDVVARRDNQLLIVKTLANIDAFDRRVAEEMSTLARFLEGTPLLVGLRTGAGDLEDGVVYLHHGVRAVSLPTLDDVVLRDDPPYAYAGPGGLYVRMEGNRLRRVRRARSLSLGALAEIAGVSRRTIQMYEEGMRATIESALRLEEFLGQPLLEAIDPLAAAEPDEPEEKEADTLDLSSFGLLERDIFRILQLVGFQVVPTGKSPFSALTREARNLILTGIDEQDQAARRKARIMSSISQVTERSGVFVVRTETTRRDLEGTAIVSRKELIKIREPEQLRRLIEERRRRTPKPDV